MTDSTKAARSGSKGFNGERAAKPAAILVAIQLPGVSDAEHQADLAELGRLAHTCGFEVAHHVSQKRDALAAAAVVGEGKLGELAGLAKSLKRGNAIADDAYADVDTDVDEDEDEDASSRAVAVIVDHEITPSQARNLERATGAEVLDRTGLIVEIFHRHARSREARLQVEVARLLYVAPRLRESGRGAGDRQRGGIGGKGAGESALELDRRKIRDRIAELRAELAQIQNAQATRRALRRDARRVALVGYTNAGKSSLMRALTGSEVLVEDKLFATLDTTVRVLKPETKPRILVSDTVGFIKKLPHDLVASFRSTLDEALEASLLLFVADASDPTFRSQLEVTRSVLEEIGATGIPSKLILNKTDRLTEGDRAALEAEFPGAIFLSAHNPGDVTRLHGLLVDHFEEAMVTAEVFVPYTKQSLIGEVYENARVLSETYDDEGTRFSVRVHPDTLAKLRDRLA